MGVSALNFSREGKMSKLANATPFRYHGDSTAISEGDAVQSDSLALSSPSKNDAKLSPTDSFEGKPNAGINRKDLEGSTVESEVKKKRYNTDKGYFMIKELLSTERTYKKNLDVINKVRFRICQFKNFLLLGMGELFISSYSLSLI